MDVRAYVKWNPYQRRRRAIVKTLCYRVVMIVLTIVVAWVITQNATDAMSIGIIANVAKTVTYYVYERLWDRITWGIQAQAV